MNEVIFVPMITLVYICALKKDKQTIHHEQKIRQEDIIFISNRTDQTEYNSLYQHKH